MSYSITAETINIDQQIQCIKIYQYKMKEHDDKFHPNCINDFYSYIETLSPEDKLLISQIYANGRNAAISLNCIIGEFTDYSQTPILNELIDGLSANLEYHRNKCKNNYISVEKRMNALNQYCWSITKMIDISKDICTDIDQMLNILNLLKQTKTYRLQKGILKMDDMDNAKKTLPTIQNNYSGTFQQSQFQSGANSTMNIHQINHQTLQQVCKQIREVINNSQELTSIKQILNTDINNFENAQSSTERKSAFESLLSNSSSIATLWSTLAPYIPELTKYLG